MTDRRDDTLRSLLGESPLRDILRADLAVGLLLGAASGWLADEHPERAVDLAASAAALAGVVVGAVIAATALVVAFMSPAFLRKMRRIDEDPVSYLGPYILTGVVGTCGTVLSLVLAATPTSSPAQWLIPLAVLAGGSCGWALASLVPVFTNLIRFIRLQQDAAEVPDEAVPPGG